MKRVWYFWTTSENVFYCETFASACGEIGFTGFTWIGQNVW